MQFVPMQQKPKSEQRRLLSVFDKLDPSARAMLLAFAEFLGQRQTTPDTIPADDATPPQPKSIERPVKESVVKAIRRLSETYYMLERERLLEDSNFPAVAYLFTGFAPRRFLRPMRRATAIEFARR